MISSITVSCLDPEAAPHHHTTNAMFDCSYDGLFMKVELVLHHMKWDSNLPGWAFISSLHRVFPQSFGAHEDIFFLSQYKTILCVLFDQ